MLGKTDLDREVVYDLYRENQKGEKFIVELQKAKQKYFKDRVVYYSSFSIQEQGKRGEWYYRLQAVYVIGILDFIIYEENPKKIVVSRYKLLDIERHTPFYDKLTFITIQMPNFNKKEAELENNFDKWLYVIKNLETLERIPERVKDKLFLKLFKVAEIAKLNNDEQRVYEESFAYCRDLKNSLDLTKQEGYKHAEATYSGKLQKSEKEKEAAKAEKERGKKMKQNKNYLKPSDK